MSRVLTISDDLYGKLEEAAHRHGLTQISELLEHWQAADEELARRAQTVRQIGAVRERMRATYGEMPDSVDLIREDRGR